MIIAVKGWTRSLKTGLGAYLAKYYIPWYIKDRAKKLPLPGIVDHVEVCYSNSTLNDMPFPVEKMTSKELVKKMFEVYRKHQKGVLIFFDEAHKELNPRLWDKREKEETAEMAGVYQDDKLGTHMIITYFAGSDKEELLGVDKMIRAAIGRLYEILSREKSIMKRDKIKYRLTNEAEGRKPKIKYLRNVSKYFHLWETLEPTD